MKTRYKTVLIILGTFLLGAVVGALGSQLYYRYRVNQIVTARSPQHMFSFVERAVRPEPGQLSELREILQKHGRLAYGNLQENRQRQLHQFQSLKEELAKVLTPEQMRRFEERLQRRQRYLRRDRREDREDREDRPRKNNGGRHRRST